MSRQRKMFSLLFLLLQSAVFATAMADDSQETADMAQVVADAPPADSAARQSENDAAGLQQALREHGWQVQSVGADGSVIVTLPQAAAPAEEAAPPAEPSADTAQVVTEAPPADDTARQSENDAAGLQQVLRERGWQVQSVGADGSVIVTLPQAAAAAEAAPPAEETEATAASEESADDTEAAAAPESATPAAGLQQALREHGWQVQSVGADGSVIVTLPQAAVPAAEAAPPAEETEAAAASEESADDTETAAAPESATPAAGLQQALREHGWQVQSVGADGSVIVTLPQAAAPAEEAAPPAEETEAAAASEKSADEPAAPAVDVQELHKILNARGWQSEIRDGMLIARFAESAPEPAPETYVTLSVPAKDLERLSALLRAQGWGLQGETVIRLSAPAGP